MCQQLSSFPVRELLKACTACPITQPLLPQVITINTNVLLFDQPGRINVWRNSFQACWWHYMTATSQALDAVGLDPAHDHFDVSSCEAEMPQREKNLQKKAAA